jgi:hypothetical protein
MDAAPGSRQTFRFADFEFDARSGDLRRHGRPVRLPAQPFQILILEMAYEQRAFEVLGFSGSLFDLLQDDPRYRDLVGRMGLADAHFPARRAGNGKGS